MDGNRQQNGRFRPGNRANPNGRPRKGRSVNATILKELNASVPVTENQKRKNISKLSASLKQVANQGASGDLRAAKLTLDLALKAEREQEALPQAPPLTENDRDIVNRFIARLRATFVEETTDVDA